MRLRGFVRRVGDDADVGERGLDEHRGNIAVRDLLAARLVDILASDYVPRSMLDAAFMISADPGLDYDLPSAVAMVTRSPALAGGLTDRGAIETGLKADLIRVNGINLGWIATASEHHMQSQTLGRGPGWLAENRWQGIFPYEQNPRFTNPTSGILGNTNNKIVDAAFPAHVSFDWGDTQRIQRWLTLMKTREVHTRESFIEAQLDTVSFTARSLLPLIGADLWFTGEAAPDGTPERLRQRALEIMAKWNGEMNEHLPEPLIYMAWVRALQDRLIRDEIGPMADEFTHIEPIFLERVYRNVEGAAGWCDVVQSAVVETCADLARIALDEALLGLSETYGPNVESWRWGDVHQAAQDHPVMGDVPVLRYFVNIRQSTSGDDSTLMRGVTKGSGPDPYLNVHGAGYRGVYDFADPDSSVFIISTGQSGHPLSRHYDNLGERWRRGEYIPMSLDPDLARAAAVGDTVLTPAEVAE